MSTKTLLRRLLESVRTFDGNFEAFPDDEALIQHIRERDFYGSPLNEIEFAVPYPTLPTVPSPKWDGTNFGNAPAENLGAPVNSVFSLGENTVQMTCADERLHTAEPTRYPPHVSLAANETKPSGIFARELSPGNDPLQIAQDIDVLSVWPVPSLGERDALPVRAVIFLEAIRCLAAPKTDTNVDRLAEGLLAPGKLKKGYFAQQLRGFNGPLVLKDNDPTEHTLSVAELGGEHLQRRLFRETFLAVYMHLLLRHLAARMPSFIVGVVNVLDNGRRGRLFEQALRLNADPIWTPTIRAAYHCIRRNAFRTLYLEPVHFLDGLKGLQELPLNNQGPNGIEKAGLSIRLPGTLAAVINLCIERTGPGGSLYADKRRNEMQALLDDTKRIERADDILQPALWQEYIYPAGDKQHDLGPSVHLATWSCLCAVLEALAAGVLTANLDAPVGVPPKGA